MTAVIFSHGQESGPWGTKIRSMAERVKKLGCAAHSIDYQGITEPTERVEKCVRECAEIDGQIVLVGSSMGGYVATAAAQRVGAVGLFVLAPAYFMEGYEDLTPEPPAIPFCVVHGWHDDIVPVENSIRYARSCGATLHIVDGDHRLTANVEEINQHLEQFLGRLPG